jgi:hypothetical protein
MCSLSEVHKMNVQWESCACPSVSFMRETTQWILMKLSIEGSSLNLLHTFNFTSYQSVTLLLCVNLLFIKVIKNCSLCRQLVHDKI